LQRAAQAVVRCAFILVHPSGEQLAEIARLCDADQLNVHIDAVVPLQDVAQAHKLSESRHVRGKLVLTVAQASFVFSYSGRTNLQWKRGHA
jgi:NADPH:quinone reductase-like Zn-dependent oxidoreductase